MGYKVNTAKGFSVIGESMVKLQANKEKIAYRADNHYLIGLNDYSLSFSCEDQQPAFDFYAAAAVTDFVTIPEGMVTKQLPPSKYVIFYFTGKPQDSLQPVADYIYKEWFPASSCQFNENNMYDFTKSSDIVDENGNSAIEYWIPIL